MSNEQVWIRKKIGEYVITIAHQLNCMDKDMKYNGSRFIVQRISVV